MERVGMCEFTERGREKYVVRRGTKMDDIRTQNLDYISSWQFSQVPIETIPSCTEGKTQRGYGRSSRK